MSEVIIWKKSFEVFVFIALSTADGCTTKFLELHCEKTRKFFDVKKFCLGGVEYT